MRNKNVTYIAPEKDEERQCYQVLNDLDFIGGKVNGFLTQKKYMRNEIWSLINTKGPPSWFVTLTPADFIHPISLYYAGTDTEFRPDILSSKSESDYCEHHAAIA